jgi:hypothetical protein
MISYWPIRLPGGERTASAPDLSPPAVEAGIVRGIGRSRYATVPVLAARWRHLNKHPDAPMLRAAARNVNDAARVRLSGPTRAAKGMET